MPGSLGTVADGAKPCDAKQVAAGINHAPVGGELLSRGRVRGIDACLSCQNRFTGASIFHAKIDGREREAWIMKRLEILRSGILLELRSLRSGYKRAQHNLEFRLFRQLHKTRSQRQCQNRFVWRRIHNTFWAGLAESANPRQRLEERNLIGSHLLDRGVDALARRLDANGMDLPKLVRRQEFIKARGWRLDSLFARGQTHANQKQRHTSSDQEH